MNSVVKVLSGLLDLIEKGFRKIPVKYRWPSFVFVAFAAAWCFVHINSYSADKHHLNGFYLILGVICSGIVVDIFIAAASENTDK